MRFRVAALLALPCAGVFVWACATAVVPNDTTELPESGITPLMLDVESRYRALKSFSLPSMGEDGTRRHIELGVRGAPAEVGPAMEDVRRGVEGLGGTYQ